MYAPDIGIGDGKPIRRFIRLTAVIYEKRLWQTTRANAMR